MDLSKFSAFKYEHAGRRVITPRRRWVLGVALVLALAVSVIGFPFGLIALLIPLLVFSTAPKMLYIGPRYLICGNDIVYFHNVTGMTLEPAAGSLMLVCAGQGVFTLRRDRFPTNARKDFKIAANKKAKFEKASRRLIEKVLRMSPKVELNGISRDDHVSA
ncbi:MAG: hypothetical protein EG825_02405 [Rhodocyclaceae bacterium]|nr:hypothetical protein [Rhodocyclaceae bacterium]